MNSTRFSRLNQSDDQSVPLTPMNHEPLQYSNAISDAGSQIPKRWQSKKADHATQYTYVQSPSGSFSQDTKGRKTTGDRFRRTSRLSFIANPVSNFRIPTFAAPWQHEKADSHLTQAGQASTVRYFDPKKQWRRLLANGLLQWLVTAVIVCAMAATLYGFSKPNWISRGQKYTFNAIITLLSLCLSLAIVTALRSYAKLLSWRFLASQYRDLQDFELIMNCDSQSKVLKLLWAGRTQGKWLNGTQILCLISLSLVIGLQIVISMLGLTYSIDTSAGYIEWVYGSVSVVDLSDICQSWNCTDLDLDDPDSHFIDQTASANFYGLVGQNFALWYANPGEDAAGLETIYTSDNETFFYQFGDQGTDGKNTNVGVTDRYVVQNTTCANLKIISGGFVENETLVWEDERGLQQELYVEDISVLTTTYIGNGSEASYCGDRCTRLLVLNTGYQGDTTPGNETIQPMLFGCNSTVGQVQNAKSCTNETECALTDDLARILAGAIGWSGTYYGDDAHSLQYRNYPLGSPYCWYDAEDYDDDFWKQQNDPRVVARVISTFATDAIAAMDDTGPRKTLPGYYPSTASELTVQWNYSIPILCVVPGVQLIVLLIVCIWANGAVVKDGSYLATARLLRPVVEKLDRYGCALTGDEIARELGNFKIIYGARAPKGTNNPSIYDPECQNLDWHLGIIAQSEGYGNVPEEGWNPGRRFPVGKYD